MRKYIRLFESHDIGQLNCAIGFIENNMESIGAKYGNQAGKTAVSILVDLRDNGDKGRDYGKVQGFEKANEVYQRALQKAIELKASNPSEFGKLSGIGSGTKRYFRRNINGQDYIIGTKPTNEQSTPFLVIGTHFTQYGSHRVDMRISEKETGEVIMAAAGEGASKEEAYSKAASDFKSKAKDLGINASPPDINTLELIE